MSSDGTDVEWVNAGSLAAGAAAQVGINAVSDNSSHFITFSSASSGNNTLKVDTDLFYNPSTNDFFNFSGNNVVQLAGDGAVEICRASGDAYIDFKNDSTEDYDVRLQQVGTTNTIQVVGNLRLNGELQDGDNNFGSSGQVLSSDGTDTKWINAGSLSAGAAAQVSVTATTSGSQFITFVEQSSGNEEVRVNTGLTYNAATNVLSATSFSGNLTGNVTATNVSGTLQTAAQTNITSVGTLTGLTVDGNVILDSTSNYLHIKGALYDKDGQSGSADQVLVSTGTQVDWKDTTTLTASNSQKITIAESDTNTDFPITFSAAPGQSGGNTLLSDNQFTYNASSNTVTAGTFSGSGASLTSLNASNLQSGTVADARIPNLNASKINAGTFDVARIPDLSGAKITSGTVAAARIDNLNASKITAGTLADARLSNSSLFVTGMIMMYTGSTAPSGWAICNGQNGTPDLRNRFIVGAGNSYNVGVTGGFDSVSLSESQIPSHTHSFSGSSSHSHGINDPGHTHTMNFNQGNIISSGGAFGLKDSGTANRINTNTTGISVNSQSVTISGNTGGTGGGQAHENRPPYYALMFIMKL